MKILVIGSEGYIGRRLVPYLKDKGYDVDGMDRGYYGTSKSNTFFGDYGVYQELLYEQYETIILLAGHSSPSLSENDKEGSFTNNVINFSSLLGKLKKGQRLLYASSASVCNGLIEAKEDTPLNHAISHYDMQKQIIEKRALLSDCTTIGLRFGTIAGYSETPRLDSILNSVYHDAINKGEVTITNSSNMRSYLGMNDMCRAVECLIGLPNPEKIYNIASGTESINDISEKISFLTGAKINNQGGNNNYSFWVNCERINEVVPMMETLTSICHDMGDMVAKDKNIYNRNTNLFKY